MTLKQKQLNEAILGTHGLYKVCSDVKLRLFCRNKPVNVWYKSGNELFFGRPIAANLDAVAHAYKDSESL